MPRFVIYDPRSTPVANLVTDVVEAERMEPGLQHASVLTDAALPQGFALRKAKVFDGAVVMLTAQELASIAAAETAEVRDRIKAIYTRNVAESERAHRAAIETVLELMVSEINTLRAQHGLAARTAANVKNAFMTTYREKIDAL